ncbi:EF hand domain/PKD domain protein [hydrothermal vent metagenome]|uniref:EF hand domain/PKD domain protein n=1 Tax=hydrothermal vent metagenome TaxID=652676 RepID=A0A1W1DBR3_9ZZZZ
MLFPRLLATKTTLINLLIALVLISGTALANNTSLLANTTGINTQFNALNNSLTGTVFNNSNSYTQVCLDLNNSQSCELEEPSAQLDKQDQFVFNTISRYNQTDINLIAYNQDSTTLIQVFKQDGQFLSTPTANTTNTTSGNRASLMSPATANSINIYSHNNKQLTNAVLKLYKEGQDTGETLTIDNGVISGDGDVEFDSIKADADAYQDNMNMLDMYETLDRIGQDTNTVQNHAADTNNDGVINIIDMYAVLDSIDQDPQSFDLIDKDGQRVTNLNSLDNTQDNNLTLIANGDVNNSGSFKEDYTRDTDNPIDTNTPPTLDSIAGQSIDINSTIIITLSATDAQNHEIFYSVSSDNDDVAAWMYNANQISLTSYNEFAGDVNITITADDRQTDNNIATTTFTLSVEDKPETNTPPTLDSIADQSIDNNGTITISLSATDAQNHSITYSASADNYNVTANITNTNQLVLTSYNEFAGDVNITITADDGQTDNNTATTTFTLSVEAKAPVINLSPSVTSISSSYLTTNKSTTISIIATDPENDALTYSATSSDVNVATVSIQDNKLTFNSLAIGTATITVEVSDNINPAVSISFDVGVMAASTNPNSSTISIAGALANAGVELYELDLIRNQTKTTADIEANNEYNYLTYTTTNEQGEFDFGTLDYLDDNQYYLLKASGGSDLDANGDGTLDDEVSNQGSVYALLSGAQLKAGSIKVTPLSDITYHFTKSALHLMSNKETSNRLDYISKELIGIDLNEDTLIDQLDIIHLTTANQDQIDWLNWMIQAKVVIQSPWSNNSIIDTYHNNLTDEQLIRITQMFVNTLGVNYDHKYNSTQVRISVSSFLYGHITSSDNIINYNSDPGVDQSSNVDYAHYEKSDTETITLTATPVAGREVLEWEGCQSVSADLSTCTVALDGDKGVRASFGSSVVLVSGTHHVSLSAATINLPYAGTVQVSVAPGDTDLISQMDSVQSGSFISAVLKNLRFSKVTSVGKISQYVYEFGYEEDNVLNVIESGTLTTSGDISIQNTVDGASANLATLDLSGYNAVMTFTPAVPGIKLIQTSAANGSGFEILVDQSLVDAQNTSGNRAGLLDDLTAGGLAVKQWKEDSTFFEACKIVSEATDQLKSKISCAVTTADSANTDEDKKGFIGMGLQFAIDARINTDKWFSEPDYDVEAAITADIFAGAQVEYLKDTRNKLVAKILLGKIDIIKRLSTAGGPAAIIAAQAVAEVVELNAILYIGADGNITINGLDKIKSKALFDFKKIVSAESTVGMRRTNQGADAHIKKVEYTGFKKKAGGSDWAFKVGGHDVSAFKNSNGSILFDQFRVSLQSGLDLNLAKGLFKGKATIGPYIEAHHTPKPNTAIEKCNEVSSGILAKMEAEAAYGIWKLEPIAYTSPNPTRLQSLDFSIGPCDSVEFDRPFTDLSEYGGSYTDAQASYGGSAYDFTMHRSHPNSFFYQTNPIIQDNTITIKGESDNTLVELKIKKALITHRGYQGTEQYKDIVIASKWFYPSGQLMMDVNYQPCNVESFKSGSCELYTDHALHGPAKFYNSDGTLMSSGEFSGGNMTGEWQFGNKLKVTYGITESGYSSYIYEIYDADTLTITLNQGVLSAVGTTKRIDNYSEKRDPMPVSTIGDERKIVIHMGEKVTVYKYLYNTCDVECVVTSYYNHEISFVNGKRTEVKSFRDCTTGARDAIYNVCQEYESEEEVNVSVANVVFELLGKTDEWAELLYNNDGLY